MATQEMLVAELRRRAREGRVPCAAALAIAHELGMAPQAVGRAANEAGIKIADCQLGCFRGRERGRSAPKALCIVGHKRVGKTTLIERLIPELRRRGYRVATVKRPAHTFDFDVPGKDSRRHFEAGADASLVYGHGKVALVRRTAQPQPLEGLVAECLPDADLVLVEGHKGSPLPKLEVFRTGTHPAPLYNGEPEYLAIASDAPLELGVPWLRLDDTAGIADFIAARFPLPHERPASD